MRRGSDIGGYAIGGAGMVLWRLVRVAARVLMSGSEEMQVAWWAVQDRSCGGFF